MRTSPKDVKFITPPNKLKKKVGGGGVPKDRIEKAQDHIVNNTVNFVPQAQEFISEVTKLCKDAQNANTTITQDQLAKPIMNLKANGGMFQYDLITDVADICLTFTEEIETINPDAINVITAHVNTIQIIIKNDMKGNGGPEGKLLIKELQKACNRYFKKHTPYSPSINRF